MADEPLPSESTPSREDLARLEMRSTVISRTTTWALIAAFVCFISTPAILDWIVSERTERIAPRPWSQLTQLPGQTLARFKETGASGESLGLIDRILATNRVFLAGLRSFEDGLADEGAVSSRLRPPAQSILSGGPGVGNERVYLGRDGWLFYRPDVEYVVGAGFLDPAEMRRRQESDRESIDQLQPDPRRAIVDFKQQLARRGILLIVMPTPVKPAMHPEKLANAGGLTIPVQNPSYRAFVDALRRDDVIVFDVADELARDGDQAATHYLATDTHWRPEAMERAVELLGRLIRSEVSLPEVPAETYRVEPREISNVGDTAAMLDLPAGHRLNQPESVTMHRVVDSEGMPWQPSRVADVLVLGDSFSNIYSLASLGWGEGGGLVEHLGRVLARPIDRIVQNDDGAFATRARLRQDLASGTDRLFGKRVVVLQFAARELAGGDWKRIELPPPATP